MEKKGRVRSLHGRSVSVKSGSLSEGGLEKSVFARRGGRRLQSASSVGQTDMRFLQHSSLPAPDQPKPVMWVVSYLFTSWEEGRVSETDSVWDLKER